MPTQAEFDALLADNELQLKTVDEQQKQLAQAADDKADLEAALAKAENRAAVAEKIARDKVATEVADLGRRTSGAENARAKAEGDKANAELEREQMKKQRDDAIAERDLVQDQLDVEKAKTAALSQKLAGIRNAAA